MFRVSKTVKKRKVKMPTETANHGVWDYSKRYVPDDLYISNYHFSRTSEVFSCDLLRSLRGCGVRLHYLSTGGVCALHFRSRPLRPLPFLISGPFVTFPPFPSFPYPFPCWLFPDSYITFPPLLPITLPSRHSPVPLPFLQCAAPAPYTEAREAANAEAAATERAAPDVAATSPPSPPSPAPVSASAPAPVPSPIPAPAPVQRLDGPPRRPSEAETTAAGLSPAQR